MREIRKENKLLEDINNFLCMPALFHSIALTIIRPEKYNYDKVGMTFKGWVGKYEVIIKTVQISTFNRLLIIDRLKSLSKSDLVKRNAMHFL